MINVQLSPAPATPARPAESSPAGTPAPSVASNVHGILESPSLNTPNARDVLSRSRRDLQNPAPSTDPRSAAIRQFAEALVEDGDRQLALNFANSQIHRRVAATPGRGFGEDKVAVPPGSTFGLAWAELADALHAQPFKAFAEAKGLDLASLVIKPNGDLTGSSNNQPVSFSLAQDRDWVAASSAVVAAAAKIPGDIRFHGRGHASADNIGAFYRVPRSRLDSDDALSTIDQLMKQKTFSSLSNTDSYYAAQYAPVQQRQKDAKQHVVDLPPQRLSQLLAGFTPVTAAQKVQEADRALARLCSQALAQESPSTLQDVPEYSTFNQVRNYLLAAMTGTAFTTFVRDNNLELSSLRIHPIDGTLIGKVKGVDTTFLLNGLSDWSSIWPEVQLAVEQMAAGSDAYVYYPSTSSATLSEVLEFYAEAVPRSYFPEPNWARKGREACLRRSAELTQNNGFKALTSQDASDIRSSSLQAAQQAVTSQLTGKPLTPSPLETLATAVIPQDKAEDGTALMEDVQDFPEQPEIPAQHLNEQNRQKTAVGDTNDRNALISQLKHGTINNDDTTRFIVDPDSSHRPKGATTVRKFLSDHGWYGVTWKAEKENLLRALQTPLPQSPPLGDHWGFLSTDLALSAEQRGTVSEFVTRSMGSHDNLLSYLSADLAYPTLDQLLSSAKGQALALALHTEMKGAATPTSQKQWLLTALVLDLDPQAGTQRNTVAGYDLMQPQNWGLGADKIRDRFNQYLTDTKKIPATLAPVASRLLMSGIAPQFLVRDVPQSMTLGSPEWVSFTTAVKRIELSAPGATTNMTYPHVMDYHSISPICAAETRLQAIAQMNPVIDWAIINNHLAKNDKDEYTLEQLTSSQGTLQKQIKETAEARRYLRKFQPPNRRAMALDALKAQFGTGIDFESRYLREKIAGGLLSGIPASIVEVYEAGRLGESWSSDRPGVNDEHLRTQANQLPDINAKFDKAIEEDFTLRRNHTLSLFKDMFSKLPLEERDSLNLGAVEFLQVQGAGSGIVMTSSYKGVRRDFAVYPATRQIVRIPDIDSSTPLGQTVSLTLDAEAFKTSTEPKPGVKSEVVLRVSEQWILEEADDGDKRPELRERAFLERTASHLPSNYDSERMEDLAKVLVDTTYLRKSAFIDIHRGQYNAVENAVEPSDVFKGVLRAVPGGTSLLDIYHGEYARAAGDLAIDIAIYAATEGAGKLWSVAKTGAAWTAAKVSARFIEKFGTKEAESIALKDMTAASTSKSFSSVSRMQGSPLADQVAGKFIPEADMADGTVIRSGNHEQIKLTAIRRDGEWYAYDAKAMAAYGPALDGFVSDTSSTLSHETFSDGTQALVTEKPLTADAYTLSRAHGFDLASEGKVYRYDTRNPGLLTDLASADHFKPLDGFEAICPAPAIGGGRVRRGANDTCFSKVLENLSGELTQELQALEHVRLFPSPPKFLKKDQFVIFEKRRFKMVESEMGPQLIPTLDSKPITYKPQITGSIKHDPQFGLYSAETNEALDQETRVVKLNRISDLCDDKREVRGIVVNNHAAGSTDKYLVIEADTLEFYYAKLSDTPNAELTFKKCTVNEMPLINSYQNKFSVRQGVSKVPIDASFIALPKLNSAFAELERIGYPKQAVDELRAMCDDLTKEQLREVIYQLQRVKAIGKANLALRPNQLSSLAKPDGFTTWTAEQQNKFYAQQAKNSVNRSMKATGLGPGNQIRSTTDLARAHAANMAVGWMRRTFPSHALNRTDMILKAGAGNCGEMALVSKDIITKSGGRAYEWHASDAHVFTVVGGPPFLPSGTVNFSEAAWADAWIVDPLADIACPAREYTQKLREVMTQWERGNMKIIDGGSPMSPLDRNWMDALTVKPKTPFTHGYNHA